MKVLTVSDIVLGQLEDPNNLLKQYGDVEAVISCGDMPATYLEFIVSVLNVPLYFVRGNHDTDYAEGRPGGENLHGHFVTFKGFTFAGMEGSIRYNDGPIQYSEGEMLRMVLGMAPVILRRRMFGQHGIDVMVTHSPPRGIHDQKDRAHRGFQAFNRLIQWYRPRYLIHGHVDVLDRRKQIETVVGTTTVVNINPVKVMNFEKSST